MPKRIEILLTQFFKKKLPLIVFLISGQVRFKKFFLPATLIKFKDQNSTEAEMKIVS